MENKNKKSTSILDTWYTHLLTDVLYFHAARQAHMRASKYAKNIEKAEKYWNSLVKSEDKILSKYNGDSLKAYDELEPIYIQMEGAHYGIGEAYAPLFKEVATVHILSTAALEAHINSIAKEKLKGKSFESFERIALEAKWLFLPKILGLSGFNPGHPPFQQFTQMLKYRNCLVHYKRLKEKWEYGTIPQFVQKLGLTLADSEKSVRCVENMVRELAKQFRLDAPYWLRKNINEMDYFEILT